MLIASIYPDDDRLIIQWNCRVILILVMLFSVVHKIFSSEFISGSYLSFLGLDGSLFKPFREIDSYNNMVLENQEAVASLKDQNPMAYGSVKLLQPFAGYSLFMTVFSYITVIVEFVIGFLLIVRQSSLLNYILPTFLVCLLFTRSETGFIALISILSIGQLENEHDKSKVIYYFIFITNLCFISSS